MRSPLLGRAAHSLLKKLEHGEELTYEKGAGYWLDYEHVSSRAAMQLLRLCLIRLDYGEEDGYCVYIISDDGRKLLADPNYMPTIVQHLKARAS